MLKPAYFHTTKEELDRLRSDLDKVEEDIKTLLAVSGFPSTIIVDGKKFVLGIDLGDDY